MSASPTSFGRGALLFRSLFSSNGLATMGDALEKLGGSVMNLVLGALIVWVGQTTFQHAGILAGVDEKFTTIDKQFQEDDKRHESMRKWLETVVTDIKDSNRSQFTAKEGDKLISQIRQVEGAALELERQFGRRLQDLELQLVALQATGQNAPQVAALQAELAQLRYAITKTATSYTQSQYQGSQPGPATVSQQPVYLPPVTSRR
jgi:septal ring factor EnvC (AmiA/AmiB activator)